MQGRPDHAHLLGIDADGDPGWLIDLVAELRPRPGESPDAAVARLDALSATLAADASLARAVASVALSASRRATAAPAVRVRGRIRAGLSVRTVPAGMPAHPAGDAEPPALDRSDRRSLLAPGRS